MHSAQFVACAGSDEGFAIAPILAQLTANPALPWSYGWGTASGAFALLDTSRNTAFGTSWCSTTSTNRVDLNAYPAGGGIALGRQGDTFVPGQWRFQPEDILLTAGGGDDPCTVVRFTAPAQGSYLFNATWQAVSVEGAGQYWFSAPAGRHGTRNAYEIVRWNERVQLAAGQHVDFAFGNEARQPGTVVLRLFAQPGDAAPPARKQLIDAHAFVDYISDGRQQIDELAVSAGDRISGALFALTDTTHADFGTGHEPFACQFIVTKATGAHFVLGWEHPRDPIVRGRLLTTNTRIAAVRAGSLPLREGDSATISVRSTSGGMCVTVAVRHGAVPVAEFAFLSE